MTKLEYAKEVKVGDLLLDWEGDTAYVDRVSDSERCFEVLYIISAQKKLLNKRIAFHYGDLCGDNFHKILDEVNPEAIQVLYL